MYTRRKAILYVDGNMYIRRKAILFVDKHVYQNEGHTVC
jgi:hypothetical protein